MKDQKETGLGYILVKDAMLLKYGKPAIRSVNMQTIKFVTMSGCRYRVR